MRPLLRAGLAWLASPQALVVLDHVNDGLAFLTYGLLFLGCVAAYQQRRWSRWHLFGWWFGGNSLLYGLDLLHHHWSIMPDAVHALLRLTLARSILLGVIVGLLRELLAPRAPRSV